MAKYKELPSLKYLQECFDYNPETGDLYWKERPLHHFKSEAGMKTFNTSCVGLIPINESMQYLRVTLADYGKCTAHRIIWKLVTGNEPVGVIDHLNLNKLDNRFENLRDVSQHENMMNKGLMCNNTSGVAGLSYVKSDNVWRASININNRGYRLGTFKTKEEAVAARIHAENNKHLLTGGTCKKVKVKTELTQELLSRYFEYHQETGNLYWKHRIPDEHHSETSCNKFNARYAGEKAGGYNGQGYIVLSILGNYGVRAHRIIWILMTGKDSELLIDHINGRRDDNSWKNLREATKSQNSTNRKNNTKEGSSKYKGVYWHTSYEKWQSRIKVNGKTIHLGTFKTEYEAHLAYTEAAKLHHGEYARQS